MQIVHPGHMTQPLQPPTSDHHCQWCLHVKPFPHLFIAEILDALLHPVDFQNIPQAAIVKVLQPSNILPFSRLCFNSTHMLNYTHSHLVVQYFFNSYLFISYIYKSFNRFTKPWLYLSNKLTLVVQICAIDEFVYNCIVVG